MKHWTINKQGKLFWNKENVAKDTGLSGKTLDNYLKIFKLRTEFSWLLEPYETPVVITEEQLQAWVNKNVELTPSKTVTNYDKVAKILFDDTNQPRPEFQKYFTKPVATDIATKKKFQSNDVTREVVQYIAHMPKNSSSWEIQLHVLLRFNVSIMGYNYRAYPGLHTYI